MCTHARALSLTLPLSLIGGHDDALLCIASVSHNLPRAVPWARQRQSTGFVATFAADEYPPVFAENKSARDGSARKNAERNAARSKNARNG